MQELLDGHPQLAVLPGESNHFHTFLPRDPERIAADAQRWWLLRLITPSGIPPFWALGRPWEADADPYAVFTQRLLGLVAANPGRDVLGLAAVALAPGERTAWVEKTRATSTGSNRSARPIRRRDSSTSCATRGAWQQRSSGSTERPVGRPTSSTWG